MRLPGNASSRNAYVQDTGEVEEYPLSIGCSDPLPSRTRTARAHIQLTKNALPRRNAPGYLKPGSGVSAYAARRATDRNSTTGHKGRSRFAPNLQNTAITRYITLRNTLRRVSKRSRRSQRSECLSAVSATLLITYPPRTPTGRLTDRELLRAGVNGSVRLHAPANRTCGSNARSVIALIRGARSVR